jgi:branched-chain amino acid transport system substrate-binding protein
LKKILFISLAVVLALSVGLIGCGEGPVETDERLPITIGVTGPMTFIQGQDHMAGAEMARDEINGDDFTTDGVDVGGTLYKIELVEIETNEILDFTAGVTALEAEIADLDFVVGGFRTEAVLNYREVAVGPDGAGVMFFDCGAATKALQMSVVDDYDSYKYWFKSTPYNEVFLVTSCLKYVGLINTMLRGYAGLGAWPGDPAELKMAILMEDAEWCNPMEPYVIGFCSSYGINYTGTQKCESAATDLTSQLQAIDQDEPHMIFTILSGPPGKAYGIQQDDYVPYAFSLGINVESQDIAYNADTGAEYQMTLDTWAPGAAVTSFTLDWFDDFVTKTSRWPTYCAATYDAINALVVAIEATDSLSPDDLIPYLEDPAHAYTGTGATTAYYPKGAIDMELILGPTYAGEFALNASQAYELYPHLVDYYGYANFTDMAANWIGHGRFGDFNTLAGHVQHDTVYGPGWQTGIAVQWQEIEGTWKKVCVWPMDLGEAYDAALTDEHGNWNFAYPGTEALAIPPEWLTKFGP